MIEVPNISLPTIDMCEIIMPCIGEAICEVSNTTPVSEDFFIIGQSLLNGDDVLS